MASRPLPAICQGALYSMANAACRDNVGTDVWFMTYIWVPEWAWARLRNRAARRHRRTLGRGLEQILTRTDAKSRRISVFGPQYVEKLTTKPKLSMWAVRTKAESCICVDDLLVGFANIRLMAHTYHDRSLTNGGIT